MPDPLERLAALQAGDLPVHGGRTLAYVYDSGDPEIDRVAREAVAAYAASNALDLPVAGIFDLADPAKAAAASAKAGRAGKVLFRGA